MVSDETVIIRSDCEGIRQQSFADKILPFSVYDSQDPEDLWERMAAYEVKTGGRLLARMDS